MEECGLVEKALEELRKKELKIVSHSLALGAFSDGFALGHSSFSCAVVSKIGSNTVALGDMKSEFSHCNYTLFMYFAVG